jgi:hypothetical protein
LLRLRHRRRRLNDLTANLTGRAVDDDSDQETVYDLHRTINRAIAGQCQQLDWGKINLIIFLKTLFTVGNSATRRCSEQRYLIQNARIDFFEFDRATQNVVLDLYAAS